MSSIVWSIFGFLYVYSLQGLAERQSFSITPTDVRVPVGGAAVLHCAVAQQAGPVQWSKEGLLLGFDRNIPGFNRYSMVGDGTEGTHNLAIENTTLEDEGEYECQVGPAENHPPISAKAILIILLPASDIEIQGHDNHSKVAVELPDSLTLICYVKGGKPAPAIRWYRNSVKLNEEVATVSVKDNEDKSQTSTSTMKLHPLPHDNGARYDCEAQRLKIEGDPKIYFKTLSTRVILDVRFAPGRPVIEGYRPGEIVRMGDALNLRCVSRGGNPLAQVTWYKNGVINDQSYTSNDWESVNELNHVADPSDNGAIYTCRATSSVAKELYETSISFKVHYAPSEVTIDYPKEAKAGDVLTLVCTTGESNPASEVSWVVDGKPISSPNIVTLQDKGGWITRTEITINITSEERNMKLVSCYAINQALGETVVGSASISILYAPDPPSIFGYIEGIPIKAGALQRLTCVSQGGNPLPTVKWFKKDKEVKDMQTTTNGNVISVEVTIIAADNDNNAIYRCESTSAAMADPLIATTKLIVHFPPSAVTIKTRPRRPKAGHKLSLMCETKSSYPAAQISWWKSGEPMDSGSTSWLSSYNGGFSSKNTLTINVTSEDDRSIFTCKATNEAVQQSVHDAIILRVLYKPIFLKQGPVVADVKEDDPLQINMTAKANPDNVTYEWLKDDLTVMEGPILNLSIVKREDAGQYICRAMNDIGFTEILLVVKVLYPAKIVMEDPTLAEDAAIYVIAEEESDPVLNCTAEGYPLSEDIIQWQRESFDMIGRTKSSSSLIKSSLLGKVEQRRSELIVLNVSREDSGDFTCFVNNQVGVSSSRKVTLLVKQPPSIVDADANSKVKSDRKVTSELQCKAEGVPEVKFTWFLEGVVITKNIRISQSGERHSHMIWGSKLAIQNVEVKDFGEYKCVARNEGGFDTAKVILEANSAPDPPASVRVVQRTIDELLISWMPAFDGGHDQTYRIRYRIVESPKANYIDVYPRNITSMWLEKLESNTTYDIAVMARNDVGNSNYTTDKVRAKTLAKPDEKKHSPDPGEGMDMNENIFRLLVSSAAIVFLFLLVLNMVFMYCYYKNKRKKKKATRRDSSTSDASDGSAEESSEESSSLHSSQEVALNDFSEPSSRTTTSSPVSSSTHSPTPSLEIESRSISTESAERGAGSYIHQREQYEHSRSPYSMGSFV